MATLRILLACLMQLCCTLEGASPAPSNGWGDGIAWVGLKDGLQQSRETDKPLMLVVHKPWCGACKSLKGQFAESTPIASLSARFVMVNVQEDDELGDDQVYSPDGSYFPRILFFTPSGELMNDVYNKHGDSNYKYYYYSPAHILESMEHIINGQGSENRLTDEL